MSLYQLLREACEKAGVPYTTLFVPDEVRTDFGTMHNYQLALELDVDETASASVCQHAIASEWERYHPSDAVYVKEPPAFLCRR